MHRAIFRRAFWRAFWLDLRRARKHRQARKAVVARFLIVLFFIAYAGYYCLIFRTLHDEDTYILVGCILAVIFLIVGTVKFSQWREARAQLRLDIADAPKEVAERLTQYAHALTALNERALSELYLNKYTLPEGFEVKTRRLKINSLRASGAWDMVPSGVREWMMRPDGGWPVGMAISVLSGAEALHTLLWSLALLPQLRPLDQLLEPLDFRKLAKALTRPATGVLPTWELRVERNQADIFFSRCYAEKVVRGSIEADSDAQKEVMNEWVSAIDEQTEPEAFVGAESVRELDGDSLVNVAKSAALRLVTLRHIMELLEGKAVWDELCVMIFYPLLQDVTTDETTKQPTSEAL